MVTTVVLPAVRRGDLGPTGCWRFEAIERRFIWQARIAIVIVGADRLLHDRSRWTCGTGSASGEFWWMHAMVCLWLLFALVLFVAEPLILDRWSPRMGEPPSDAHSPCCMGALVSVALSLITILGAVAGSQGMSFL